MAEEFNAVREGKHIYGKVRFPEGEGPFPLVIFSHGFGAARVYDGEMGDSFVSRGIALAAFDFCGGGPASQSDGTMLEMSVLTEIADLDAVIDVLREHGKVDAERLFLMGNSQGGYVSACVAAKREADVRALVLNFPAFCIGDNASRLVEDEFGGIVPDQAVIGDLTIGRRYLQDAIDLDVFGLIGGYSGDVLIVHGSDDEVVPAEYSLRAACVYGKAAELGILGGMPHGFRNSLPEHYHRAISLALDFISAHL